MSELEENPGTQGTFSGGRHNALTTNVFQIFRNSEFYYLLNVSQNRILLLIAIWKKLCEQQIHKLCSGTVSSAFQIRGL